MDVTKVAERTISDDLEFLISKTVNTDKADYAVITGVQIHNWAYEFEDDSPNMEFVYPTSAYVVVNGTKTHIDLTAMPVSGAGLMVLGRWAAGLVGGACSSMYLAWQSLFRFNC